MLEIPVTQALVRLPAIDKSHLDTAFTVGLIRSGLIAVIVLAAAWRLHSLIKKRCSCHLLRSLALGPISRGSVSPAMVQFARELGFRQTFILEFSGKLIASIIATLIVLSAELLGYRSVIASAASSIVSYVLAPYRPALSLSRLTDFAGFIGWFSSAQLDLGTQLAT